MEIITLETTNGFKTTISAEDADEFVLERKWTVITHRRKLKTYLYAARPSRRGRGAKMIQLHRVILGRMFPDRIDDKRYMGDHIDGNTLNNTRENLRLVTRTQNRHNSAPHRSNASGYRGVHYMKARRNWSVTIHKDGINYFLGYFDNPIDGARAYNAKAKELYAEFARLNKIE